MLVGAELRRVAAVIITGGLAATGLSVAGLAAPSVASAAGFTCSSDAVYEVRSGDGWYVIADRVDVTAGALLAANDAAASDLLVPGDRLCLPAGADPSGSCSSYTVGSGDSWYSIAARSGVSARSLTEANGADLGRTIHPGDRLCLPAGATAPSTSGSSSTSSSSSTAAGGSYTVVPGDSWAAIAWRTDVSLGALLDVNDADSSDLIVPGDRLTLPAGAKQIDVNDPYVVEIEAAPAQGPCGYGDTWHDARSGGRRHLGTDIFSGEGNYVYAVVDGRLTGRTWDGSGSRSGNSWTLTGADGTRFFYAHLLDFAPELQVGSRVSAGQIIGWQGGTGNASAPHLHFEVRPRGGSPVNPFAILRAQGGCNNGTPYTQPGGWVPARIR